MMSLARAYTIVRCIQIALASEWTSAGVGGKIRSILTCKRPPPAPHCSLRLSFDSKSDKRFGVGFIVPRAHGWRASASGTVRAQLCSLVLLLPSRSQVARAACAGPDPTLGNDTWMRRGLYQKNAPPSLLPLERSHPRWVCLHGHGSGQVPPMHV